MKKEWYKSKTIWGFGIYFLVKYIASQGIWSNDVATPLLELISLVFGIYGARDAISKK